MAAKTWLGWSLAVAGVIAAGPLVLGRGKPDRLTALDKISRMSEVERDVLKRKYDQYRSLSEEQREELRQLHRMLEEDRTGTGKSLGVMYAYCDWLKTIDAWQQYELAQKSDPQEKAKLVAEIVKERQQRDLDVEVRPGGDRPFVDGLPRLTEEQLTRLFDALAVRLTSLSDEERQEIDAAKGLQRFGLQIRHLRKSISNPEAFFLSISDAELSEMVVASGNAELLQLLNSGPGDGQFRKRIVTVAIFMSCRQLLEADAAKVSDVDLKAYFLTLPMEDQDEMLQLGADEFKTQLRLKKMESDPVVSELRYLMGRQFSVLMRRMERLRNQGGFWGPGGPNGPPPDGRGAFDGNGGPDNRMRDGNGPRRSFRGGGPGNNSGGPPNNGPPGDGPFNDEPPGEGRPPGPPPEQNAPPDRPPPQ